MNNIIMLNETSVKDALAQGLITSNEAKHMLKVYLNQSHFSPLEVNELKPKAMVDNPQLFHASSL